MEEVKNQTTLFRDSLITYEEIIDIFKTKKIDKGWSFSEYKPSDTGKWTHSYHQYPAKFIPQLVERLIDEYISDIDIAHINDPFFWLWYNDRYCNF